MALPSPRMDATQFQRVAETCRWSERSLAVASALLVDGEPLPEVAAAHQMSKKQARVLRARFLEKAENLRLAAFMSHEPPKLAATALEPYASEIKKLRATGYTIDQIVAYLKQNDVSTSATTVRKFLRSLPA